jgi:hypothetical protein
LEKKDAQGKYVDEADLTEVEIKTVLYEIAIGKKTLASQKKSDSSENDDKDNKNQPQSTKEPFHRLNNWLM